MNKHTVEINDKFWLFYRSIVRNEMIPYQWKVLNDQIAVNIERERDDDTIPIEMSHAIENLKIAAGLKQGRHYGWVFQDSDVYKWLEAVAYSLQEKMDDQLKVLADGVVELIAAAQEPDGYLSTYFTIEAPDRKFKRLVESHELYCAGHFIEAAVAYHEATGHQLALATACKLADHIGSYFGEGRHFGYDGHQEIEIALMRLYHLTGQSKYRDLSEYFLMARGTDDGYFSRQRWEDGAENTLVPGSDRWPLSYYQAHKPVLQQDTAEGHAVRLVYMCTAMADLAASGGNGKMLEACQKIWRNIVDRRLYITGGIGSTALGESFTFDYHLPNDTMYSETCAAVGLVFFAGQMLRSAFNGEYADVMERALYNTVLAGMAIDGKHFFYVNPLECVPEASAKDPGKSHVKTVRPEWLGCACCPTNLARLIASVDRYVYTQRDDTIVANLFMNNTSVFQTSAGEFHVAQETNYPWDGRIKFKLHSEQPAKLVFGIRIPAWAASYDVTVNGRPVNVDKLNGYIYFRQSFADDEIILTLPMKIEQWHSSSAVRNNLGQIAITRGPIVYCLEEADNGPDLHMLSIKADSEMRYHYCAEELNGIGVIEAEGLIEADCGVPGNGLYRRGSSGAELSGRQLRLIPYYAWANRGSNEMRVWIRVRE